MSKLPSSPWRLRMLLLAAPKRRVLQALLQRQTSYTLTWQASYQWLVFDGCWIVIQTVFAHL